MFASVSYARWVHGVPPIHHLEFWTVQYFPSVFHFSRLVLIGPSPTIIERMITIYIRPLNGLFSHLIILFLSTLPPLITPKSQLVMAM